MSQPRYSLIAVYFVTILVGAALSPTMVAGETLSGGQADVSNTGQAPDIVINDAVIDDSAGNSEIQVAFDATGEIAANDVEVRVSGPGFYNTDSPGAERGTVNVTIPEGQFGGGNLTLNARLVNASSDGPPNASDTALVNVTSPVRLVNYTVSEETVYTGEEFTVTAAVENVGNTEEAFTVSTYDETHTKYAKHAKTIPVGAGNTETVSLTTSYSYSGTKQLTVNNQTVTNVTVEDRVKVQNVAVPEQAAVNETVEIDVTLDNPTSKEDNYELSYNLDGEFRFENGSVGAENSETVTIDTSYAEPGEKYLWIDGEQYTLWVLNDTEGSSNLSVAEVHDRTVVVGQEVFLPVEVTNHGDAAGVRNVTLTVEGETVASDAVGVEPGETEYAFLSTSFDSKGTYSATVAGQDVEITVRDEVVVDQSIEHVEGTEPESLPNIDARYTSRGWVYVTITNSTGRLDLSSLGADSSTVFEISLTVDDYEPRVLVSSGQDLNWTVQDNSDGTKTVTIRGSPAQFEYMFDAPRLENWEDVENDRADISLDAAMFLAIDDANRSEVYGAETENLRGMTIATDAQTFLPPEYHPGTDDRPPRFEIKLAAPHLTVDGNVNDGHYETFLPDDLLDAWGVTDTEQLTAAYSGGDDVNFTVTDADGGMYVHLDLHYSSGTVSISKDESTDGDDGGSSSSSGSTGGWQSGGSDDEETTTATTTVAETTTTTATETTTETATTVEEAATSTTESTTTAEETATETTTTVETAAPTTTERGATTTGADGGVPGFGVGASLAALAAVLGLVRLRADR